MTFLTGGLTWNLGDITVTSLTGLQGGEHASIMDVFASLEVIQDQIVENDADVFSTELRIDNHASGEAITWLATENLLVGGNAAFYDGELGPESYTGATWDPTCDCVIGTDVSGLATGFFTPKLRGQETHWRRCPLQLQLIPPGWS